MRLLNSTLLTAAIVVAAYGPSSRGDDRSPRPDVTDPLAVEIDKAIEISSRRFLTIEHHSPWQILHGVLALRHDFVINRPGGKPGDRVRALDWISGGASFRDIPLFRATPHGAQAQPYTQPYEFEGHPNQFLAILSMSRLGPKHKFMVPGGTGPSAVTVQQLVRHAQATVNDREEITWTLWALAHFLPPDARWKNAEGDNWSIERLVKIQESEAPNDAACGGTHGLFALTYARNVYRNAHEGRVRGAWLEADQKIRRFQAEAKAYQNSDGSFSASYFLGPHLSTDFSERIETSGHTLEWLVLAASDKELKSDWMRRGLTAVASDLSRSSDKSIQCGPLYHALHGMVLYRERTRASRTATRSTR